MSLDQVDRLVDWAQGHGAKLHHQVEIYNDKGFGIAVRVRTTDPRAGEALPPNSAVVSCPFNISLSYLNAMNKFPALPARSLCFPSRFMEVLDAHVIGHFFLMQQYLDPEGSYWGPYIKSLPQPDEHEKLGTPLYFTASDLEWIRGTDLELARNQREQMWRGDWGKGCQILNYAPEWEPWRGRWTWDLYRWAATIFSSRGFVSTLIPKELFKASTADNSARDPSKGTLSSMGVYQSSSKAQVDKTQVISMQNRDESSINQESIPCDEAFPVLFPVLDLANHNCGARVTWFSNAHTEPQDLTIIVESEIPEGQQIFNNYAPKNNTELLLGYGFCVTGRDEVTITFKPLPQDLMAIQRLRHCQTNSGESNAHQLIFHIRRQAYSRPMEDERLVDTLIFENGCVDSLGLLLANQREKDFIIAHLDYSQERTSENVFSRPLYRNMLNVLSVLLEKLQTLYDGILAAGQHLRVPKGPRQQAADIYRRGQIETLRAAVDPLQRRLDAVISQHTICCHLKKAPLVTDPFDEMRANVELITLACSFSWLLTTRPDTYQQVIPIIGKELDVTVTPHLDWAELVPDWDFTLWCFWLYIVASTHRSEKEPHIPSDTVTSWIDQMLSIYDTAPHLSTCPFHGDRDELETLNNMISDFHSLQYLGASDDLVNVVSAIARDEGFVLDVLMHDALGKERVRQRVMCMNKFKDDDVAWNGSVGDVSRAREVCGIRE